MPEMRGKHLSTDQDKILLVCLKKVSLIIPLAGILTDVIELTGLRRWEFPCTRHFERVEAMAPPPHSLL